MNDNRPALADSELSPQEQGSTTPLVVENTVKMWNERIKKAKAYFDEDYKRMRSNMEFAAGIQWNGQESVDDKENRYISNIVTQHISNKVASLYAKDPKCKAKQRERLDFVLWDGTVEQAQQAEQAMQMAMMSGQQNPQSLQAMQMVADITQGRQWQQLCKRVGKTLEVLYGYQCDIQAPSFKKQMKQLVRRVVTTGVGFIRVNYVTVGDHVLSSAISDDSLAMRIKRIQAIAEGITEDKILEDDPRVEQMKLLLESVQSSVVAGDMQDVEERLEFDFPSATSIIIDPKCKALKGFIGANWIAQQYLMSLDDANAYFKLTGDKAIKNQGDFVCYAEDGKDKPRPNADDTTKDTAKSPLGMFWEVFDYTTKESFFICDGYDDYVQQPAPVDPEINSFWPIMALTFNDVEVEPGQKVHIYPPSDVQLLKPMQMERNNSREDLKKHRKINRPFFWTQNGWAAEEDKDKFSNHETGELIFLKGSPVNGNMQDAIGKWTGTPIDQNVYSTAPIDDDARLAVGSNQIQQQMPIRHVAATPAVIQEQARMSAVSSNVDDLDDLLSDLANASGQIMLRKFSPNTVTRVVGRGASWPDQQREDFLNAIFLDVIAASSGRPNQAVDLQNAQQIIPLLQQSGANPIAVIEYLCRILDSNIDVSQFYPQMQMPLPQPQAALPQTMQGGLPLPNSTQQPGNVGMQQGGQGFLPGVQQGG